MNHVKKTEVPADTAPVRTFLIAADGFEEVEGLTVVDLLRRARFRSPTGRPSPVPTAFESAPTGASPKYSPRTTMPSFFRAASGEPKP